jgi:hypothetical protein
MPYQRLLGSSREEGDRSAVTPSNDLAFGEFCADALVIGKEVSPERDCGPAGMLRATHQVRARQGRPAAFR